MYLPKEVPAKLQLYLDGKMEQFWLRDNQAGVIFLMTVNSVEEADGLLKVLPLGRANLLTFERCRSDRSLRLECSSNSISSHEKVTNLEIGKL